jgi:hypothetical protein
LGSGLRALAEQLALADLYPEPHLRDALAQLASADPQMIAHLMKISSATFTDAKIVVALIPLVLIYPFLQRYFVKGLVLGTVKG